MREMCSKIRKGMLPVDVDGKANYFSPNNPLPNLGSTSPTGAAMKAKKQKFARIYLCKFCKKTFTNESALSNHEIEFHNSKLNKPVNVLRIVRKLPKDKRILVEHGDYGPSSRRFLTIPLQRVPPNPPPSPFKGLIFCPRCPRSFFQSIPLIRHLQLAHFQSEKKEETKSSILQDKTENSDQMPLICKKCDTPFGKYFSYTSHVKKCLIENPRESNATQLTQVPVPSHVSQSRRKSNEVEYVSDKSEDEDADDSGDPDYSRNNTRKRKRTLRKRRKTRKRVLTIPVRRRPKEIIKQSDSPRSNSIESSTTIELLEIEDSPDEKESHLTPIISGPTSPPCSSTSPSKSTSLTETASPPSPSTSVIIMSSPSSPMTEEILSDYVPSDCEDEKQTLFGEIAYDIRNRRKTMQMAALEQNISAQKLRTMLLSFGFAIKKIPLDQLPPATVIPLNFNETSARCSIKHKQIKEIRKRGRPRKHPLPDPPQTQHSPNRVSFNNNFQGQRSKTVLESKNGEFLILTIDDSNGSEMENPRNNFVKSEIEEKKKVGRKRYPIRVDREALKRAIMSKESIKSISRRFDLPYYVVRRVRNDETPCPPTSTSPNDVAFSSIVQIQNPRPMPIPVQNGYYKYNHYLGTKMLRKSVKKSSLIWKKFNHLRYRRFIKIPNSSAPFSRFNIKTLMVNAAKRHRIFCSPAKKLLNYSKYIRKFQVMKHKLNRVLRSEDISKIMGLNPDEVSTEESDEEILEEDCSGELRVLSYYCNDCRRYFSTLKRLQIHNRNLHSHLISSGSFHTGETQITNDLPDGMIRCEFCDVPCLMDSLEDHYFISHYKEMLNESTDQENLLRPNQNEPSELDNEFIEGQTSTIELKNAFIPPTPVPFVDLDHGSVWEVEDEALGGDERKYFYSNCDCSMRNAFPNEQMRDEHKEIVHGSRPFLRLEDFGTRFNFTKTAQVKLDRFQFR